MDIVYLFYLFILSCSTFTFIKSNYDTNISYLVFGSTLLNLFGFVETVKYVFVLLLFVLYNSGIDFIKHIDNDNEHEKNKELEKENEKNKKEVDKDITNFLNMLQDMGAQLELNNNKPKFNDKFNKKLKRIKK